MGQRGKPLRLCYDLLSSWSIGNHDRLPSSSFSGKFVRKV